MTTVQRRYYQQESLDAVARFFEGGGISCLIDLATGTGKSVVISGIVREILEAVPHFRILMLVHVKELVEQNFRAVLREWPDAPIGLYSAGLGKRQAHSKIVFASIQSVYNKAKSLGHRDIVLIDECHLIPPSGSGMYKTLLEDLRRINPDIRIVGCTATAYRLGSGRLDEGDDRLFEKTVYTYGIAQGVEDGFLSPLISKATLARIDTKGVKKSGGEFMPGQLEAKILSTDVTERALDEMIELGQNRRAWLSFCAGVDHAMLLRDLSRARGIHAECVTGETPHGERDRIIRGFKAGEFRHLTGANVLTTGFDAPIVDLIAMLRPTESASLYVQICGRGTRLLGRTREDSIAAGKENCLILDFAGNVRRHGPVDCIEVKPPGGGGGEAPVKECPQCRSLIHISIMTCPDCGHEFPPPENEIHEATADASSVVMSSEQVLPEHRPVLTWGFKIWDRNPDKMPSIRVSYSWGMGVANEWVGPGQRSIFGRKADDLWFDAGGDAPPPASAEEFIRRQDELRKPEGIGVKRNGRYWDVVDRYHS